MLTVKLLILQLGALLMYAGIKGKSVPALLRGDNTVAAPNTSLNTSTSSASGSPAASTANVSGTGTGATVTGGTAVGTA